MTKRSAKLLLGVAAVTLAGFCARPLWTTHPVQAEPAPATLPVLQDVVMQGKMLGMVRNGGFDVLIPASKRGKFFERESLVQVGNARTTLTRRPSTAPLDLSNYEGQTIMIVGSDDGGTLYSSRVSEVDPAAAIQIAQNEQILEQNAKIINLLSRLGTLRQQ